MSTQFITNEKGEKIAAVIPIEEYAELMEDLEDLAAVARQRNEKGIPLKEVLKQLKIKQSANGFVRN